MFCVNKDCPKTGHSFVIYRDNSGRKLELIPEIKLLKTHLPLGDWCHCPHFKDKKI
jgi:hypothetical protein